MGDGTTNAVLCNLNIIFWCLFLARRTVWYHVKILPPDIDTKPLNIAVILNEYIASWHVNNFILVQASSFNCYSLIVFQNSQASNIGTDIWIKECAKNLFLLQLLKQTKMENWLKEVSPFFLFFDHSPWSVSTSLLFVFLQIFL